MDGETNGSQEATQGAQDQAQQQGQEQRETQQSQQEVTGGNYGTDYEKQIAERDEKIVSLEAQVAEAAKNAETAEQLAARLPNSRHRTSPTGSTSSCSSRACAT